MSTREDPELEKQVVTWISDVVGETKPEGTTVRDWLLSGDVLCRFANCIKPNAIPRFNKEPKQIFKQRENITLFIRSCRDSFGMREQDLFSTPDLYEGTNIPLVMSSLFNLGGTIQSTVPEYSGPKCGIRQVTRRSEATPSRPQTKKAEKSSPVVSVQARTDKMPVAKALSRSDSDEGPLTPTASKMSPADETPHMIDAKQLADALSHVPSSQSPNYEDGTRLLLASANDAA